MDGRIEQHVTVYVILQIIDLANRTTAKREDAQAGDVEEDFEQGVDQKFEGHEDVERVIADPVCKR